jgi:hypothetical protein
VQVTAQTHALILASGTLAPVSALTAQLFPGMDPASIGRFVCGHVVPQERLLALALGEIDMLSAFHDVCPKHCGAALQGSSHL